MFVVIPRCTMSAEQWSNAETKSGQTYMSIHGNLCYGGLLRGSVVPAKFSCLTRCMWKRRRSTRWLWYGLVDRARFVSRDVTLHRLSVLIRLVDNSPLVCISMRVTEKSVCHIIHVLNLSQSVVSASVARTSRRSPRALTSRSFCKKKGRFLKRCFSKKVRFFFKNGFLKKVGFCFFFFSKKVSLREKVRFFFKKKKKGGRKKKVFFFQKVG